MKGRGTQMDRIRYHKRLETPVYTGTIAQAQTHPKTNTEQGQSRSFKDVLEERIKRESQVSFSKHAMNRVAVRNVDLSESNLERLNEGVRLAQEKGLQEPLILVDSTAYVVSVKDNKVITVVNQDNVKGTVFSNIDGTVMI